MKRQLTWINGNGTAIWRFLIITLLSGFLTIGGWMFLQIRDLPQNHPSSTAFAEMNKKIDRKVDKEMLIVIDNRLMCIERNVNELNSFLRDYFSDRSDKK